MPPAQISLSGIIHPRKPLFARVGDVAIQPGSRRTPYIDAAIFDGSSWRALDLNSFGFDLRRRAFDQLNEIGPLMREIGNKIASCKNSSVHYDYPSGSNRRKYIYRGISFSSFSQYRTWQQY